MFSTEVSSSLLTSLYSLQFEVPFHRYLRLGVSLQVSKVRLSYFLVSGYNPLWQKIGNGCIKLEPVTLR